MTQRKTFTNAGIVEFIREMPGGNVVQYSRLTATPAVRINDILSNDAKTARLVALPEQGRIPYWATRNNKRGALRGADVDRMVKENRLPSYVRKLLKQFDNLPDSDIHVGEAIRSFRNTVEQSAGEKTTREVVTESINQQYETATHIVQLEQDVAQLQVSLARTMQETDQRLISSNATNTRAESILERLLTAVGDRLGIGDGEPESA